MLADLFQERGGADLDIRWGNPRNCHFPLFTFLKPMSLPYMGLLYGVMLIGTVN